MWAFEEHLAETFIRWLDDVDEDELEYHQREQRIKGIIQFIYNLGWVEGQACAEENRPDAEDLEKLKETVDGNNHKAEKT